MGDRSSFGYEEEIHFHTALLKEYAKEVMDNSGNAQKSNYWNEVYAWLSEPEHDKFSFLMFNDWKLQGYWYDDFQLFMKELSMFLDCSSDHEDSGFAEFCFTDGTPFKFILDYENRNIYVEYVPLEWKTMYFSGNPKMSKEWKKKLDANHVASKL